MTQQPSHEVSKKEKQGKAGSRDFPRKTKSYPSYLSSLCKLRREKAGRAAVGSRDLSLGHGKTVSRVRSAKSSENRPNCTSNEGKANSERRVRDSWKGVIPWKS